MTKNYKLHVTEADSGTRLDRFVAQNIKTLSRAKVVKLIQQSYILIDNKQVNPARKVDPGQTIEVEIPDIEPSTLLPWNKKLDIVYEDEYIIVVEKPAGIAVHPSPGHQHETIANALIAHDPDLVMVGSALRPGIIHRLDLETSGLLVVAKTEFAHRNISEQFASRLVEKLYYALVHGKPEIREAIIDAPIGRSPFNRKQMDVVSTGKNAITRYEIIATYPKTSLLRISPKTGRTHQIRVHLKSIGHPVVGDNLYGKRDESLGRHFLHASQLSFTHPENNECLKFNSELPMELENYIKDILESSPDMKDTATK